MSLAQLLVHVSSLDYMLMCHITCLHEVLGQGEALRHLLDCNLVQSCRRPYLLNAHRISKFHASY